MTETSFPHTDAVRVAHELRSVAVARMNDLCEAGGHPTIFSSFGKESMVLLDLAKRAGIGFRVAYFRANAEHDKNEFADRQINRLNAPVEEIFPHRIKYIRRGEYFSSINEFDTRGGDVVEIHGPTAKSNAEANATCAIEANKGRVLRVGPYEWGHIITGRRSVDRDPIVGPLKWPHISSQMRGGLCVSAPLLDWSDEDIAVYISAFNVEIDHRRYRLSAGRYIPSGSSTFDPDRTDHCGRCVVERSNEFVACPKRDGAFVDRTAVAMIVHRARNRALVPPVKML